ncbi:MAG: hypothetical protein K2N33_05290 [Clostridia bacterium]|nr:hypothetical protein [Clostridia bacterium]
MDKFSFIGLWDVYGGLLTEVQREITDMYFNLDLTVSEIAKEKGISRQAVSDCLKGCKNQLEEYEDKLHVYKRLQEVSLQTSYTAADINVWADKFKADHPEFTEDIKRLTDILNKE